MNDKPFRFTPVAILLGGNKLNRGIVDKLHRLGLNVLVLDWNAQPELKGDRHLQLDVKDTPRILAALKDLGLQDVRLACTSIDVAVPTAVAIHKLYGLCVPHGPVYDRPLSKAQMTLSWKENDLLNRLSFLVPAGDVDFLVKAARGREVIVKPNVSSSSRGITILPSDAGYSQYSNALGRAENASFDGQAVVEEFVRGREFTVEMLGDSFGNVAVYAISAKYHSQNAGANKVANKIHYNSPLYSHETYAKIANYGRRCFRSLGLNCSFGHLEILMREDGLLSPVEIGARSSGFICSPLVDVVSGRDFLADYMSILRGGRVSDEFFYGPDSSMYFFYDFPPGRPCRKITNLGEHLPVGIESLYSDHEAIQTGRIYQNIDNDTERHGVEVLAGCSHTLTIEAVEAAEQRMFDVMFC